MDLKNLSGDSSIVINNSISTFSGSMEDGDVPRYSNRPTSIFHTIVIYNSICSFNLIYESVYDGDSLSLASTIQVSALHSDNNKSIYRLFVL